MATRLMNNLLIRADADSQIGTGHVMRCLALAEGWREASGKAHFIMREGSPRLLQKIEVNDFGLTRLPRETSVSDDLDTLFATAETLDQPWLVLDGYHFDSVFQQTIRAAGYRLLVIDDAAQLPSYHADVLLNQNIYAERLSYCCDQDAVLLLGARYALLRSEFLTRRNRQREVPEVARRVLVTMGGSDPDNVTRKVVQALLLTHVDGLEAVVVVGPNNPHFEELRSTLSDHELTAEHRSHVSIRLVRDAPDMPGLMAWADVAVSAGGSTCWELAFMGLPSLVMVLADNQKNVAEGLDAARAAVSLGRFENITAEQIASSLTTLCRDYDRRLGLGREGRQMIDGDGCRRLVEVLMNPGRLADPNRLTIRRAKFQDAVPLWQLANDPTVRNNSFTHDPIPLDRHIEWYKGKLASPDCSIWVLELGGAIAAQVRYDRVEDDVAEIGFSVSPAFRRKGFGTKALASSFELACEELGVSRARGIVHDSNLPSTRAFLKAGFTEVGRDLVRERCCYVFERNYLTQGS